MVRKYALVRGREETNDFRLLIRQRKVELTTLRIFGSGNL